MIEGLRPYSEMSATGLDWLPAVPVHWETRRIKTVLHEVDRRTTTGEEKLLSLRMIAGLVGHNDVGGKPIPPAALVGFKKIEPGQIVMNRMRAAIGLFGVANEPGLVSPDYAVFSELVDADQQYLLRLFRVPAMGAIFRSESKGLGTGQSGFLRLYTDRFGSIRIPLPPLDEQRLIVRFLDWHGAMTGKLVRAKRRLIAVLNEQKQSIIHRAITRGIDPATKLKPSGVDWLGDVPEHWEVKRLKWVVRLQRGYDLPADQRIEGTYPVVSSGGVIGKHVECRATAPGVVMGRYGSTDAVFFLDEDFWPHNTSLFVTDFQGNAPRWCFHMLRTISKADHSGKSAVPGVDRKDLYEIMIAVPPPSDQQYIASAIDDNCAEFERSIALVKDEIALIQEFHTRLIADVVTGQLDVRAVAASLPDVAEADAAGDLTDEDDLDNDADALIDEEEAA